MSNLSRRKFLITATGSAAGALWLAACGTSKKPPATSKATGVTRDAVSGKITGGSITGDAFVQAGNSSWKCSTSPW